MKKIITIAVCAIVLAAGTLIGSRYVLAEQSGSSPESGATSYIKTLYDHLKNDLSFGSDSAGGWGDWGSFWNRIYSAATWVPSGNADTTGVVSGKTFYKDSRSQATGTKQVTGPCSTQVYHDSYGAPADQTTNCAPNWEVDTSVTGAEKKDPITGLIWSNLLRQNGSNVEFSPSVNTVWNWDGENTFTITAANASIGAVYTNNGQTFTVTYDNCSNCTTLRTVGSGLPEASGTLTKSSGTGDATLTFSAYSATTNLQVGGKTASQLCSERGDGWRLPTQKELMQAYIDGAYWNLTQPSNCFWSLTEGSSTTAWTVYLIHGLTFNLNKGYSYRVRCVR